jgi:hypothetical protein
LVRQVLDFVSAHADLLAAILKDTAINKPLVLDEVRTDGSSSPLRSTMTELLVCVCYSLQIRLVSEMFYHLVANAQSLLVQKLQQNAMRFHHALLNLFVTLSSRELSLSQNRYSYQVLSHSSTEHSIQPKIKPWLLIRLYQVEEPRRATAPLIHEINRNVIAYCRILSDSSIANGTQGLPSILFTPNLSTVLHGRGANSIPPFVLTNGALTLHHFFFVQRRRWASRLRRRLLRCRWYSST